MATLGRLRRLQGGSPAPDSSPAPDTGPAVTDRWVVALVGIDGSGKTTQARRLAAALTAAGAPATYWQNAGGRRWLGRAARRLGRADGQRLLGRRGLLLTESSLRWMAIARALVRSRLRRRIAVMDRYAFCQYASIRAHARRPMAGPARSGGSAQVRTAAERLIPWRVGDRERRPDAPRDHQHGVGGGATYRVRWGERVARMAYRIFPKPDITFLLVVNPQEAYRRIELRGTDHESLDYLTVAQEAYRSLPEHGGFVEIDAGRTLDEVTRAIFAHVPGLPPWEPHPAREIPQTSPPAVPSVPQSAGGKAA